MSADSEKMIALLTEIRDLLKHGTSTPAPTRSAPASRSSGGSGPIVKFGKSKGRALTDCADPDIAWYMRVVREGIDDPTKAKYRDSGIAHFNECRVALGLKPETFGGPARREEPPALADDSGVPF